MLSLVKMLLLTGDLGICLHSYEVSLTEGGIEAAVRSCQAAVKHFLEQALRLIEFASNQRSSQPESQAGACMYVLSNMRMVAMHHMGDV